MRRFRQSLTLAALAVALLLGGPVFAADPSLKLTWKDNADNETGFRVERKTDGGAFATVQQLPPDSVSWEDTTVTPGHTYTYRVLAFNQWGSSSPSNEAGSNTNPPAGPGGLSVTVSVTVTVTP